MTLVSAAMISFLAGCASKPTAIAPVGPGPASHQTSNSRGFLKVYSETETHEIGGNSYYYPHTGYAVYAESGVCLKRVANHVGDMDELPMLVAMPVGHYTVVAESAAYGRVRVPVVIEAGRTTNVHLNRDFGKQPQSSADELVRMPDGEIVGWHS